ncbi:methylglyoxal reductase (NADPH-dependent) gre2 [Serendipita sp. 411]|nr:methylglyoxal reductase (NADPH-dependent) gre2 [Serendipita sp. 397]KAG8821277.1 methylglyoxal reductase (NADPH-dependent) gre2 [Serendipita sp. 401]KAG8835118.1 methylglyoxal reductase (NADPH-dependent) gre2 [Serendipita sp. 400]KAG8849267.1 methylglyoxal reductase (NADPH-dependent) gre2 [Serendipita sp. 411]KAG9053848.1 methylglyoxal reductase (NADPH-dependent) gre2 [Serendipita sp. 407]
MSAVQPPALVLLTGGTGFIGSAILVNLLQKGFSVRAAVRPQSKTTTFHEHLKDYIDSGKLTFVVIPDMMVPNAFTEAVQGVEGIIHTASPLIPTDPSVEPEEVIRPAVEITRYLLEGAAASPTVKRVVITSSIAAMYEPHEGKYVYTENDWFDTAPKIVAQAGINAPGHLKYMASKVLGERSAWSWVSENTASFDLVTILPAWVWGRDVFSNPETIRSSSSNFYLLNPISEAISGKLRENQYLSASEFVDLKDAAEGHVRALTTPAAGGERIALKGGLVTWQDVFDLVNANPIEGVTVPLGNPGAGKNFTPEKYLLAEKSEKLLGMTYRKPEDALLETIRSGVEFGWKP